MIITPLMLQWAQFLVLVVGAVILIIWNVTKGGSKVSSDTIEAYSKQVELYEKRLAENANAMQTMSHQIGELTASNATKDKQIEEMHLILQNRNPELEKTLKELTGFMKSVDERLTDQGGKLTWIADHQKDES